MEYSVSGVLVKRKREECDSNDSVFLDIKRQKKSDGRDYKKEINPDIQKYFKEYVQEKIINRFIEKKTSEQNIRYLTEVIKTGDSNSLKEIIEKGGVGNSGKMLYKLAIENKAPEYIVQLLVEFAIENEQDSADVVSQLISRRFWHSIIQLLKSGKIKDDQETSFLFQALNDDDVAYGIAEAFVELVLQSVISWDKKDSDAVVVELVRKKYWWLISQLLKGGKIEDNQKKSFFLQAIEAYDPDDDDDFDEVEDMAECIPGFRKEEYKEIFPELSLVCFANCVENSAFEDDPENPVLGYLVKMNYFDHECIDSIIKSPKTLSIPEDKQKAFLNTLALNKHYEAYISLIVAKKVKVDLTEPGALTALLLEVPARYLHPLEDKNNPLIERAIRELYLDPFTIKELAAFSTIRSEKQEEVIQRLYAFGRAGLFLQLLDLKQLNLSKEESLNLCQSLYDEGFDKLFEAFLKSDKKVWFIDGAKCVNQSQVSDQEFDVMVVALKMPDNRKVYVKITGPGVIIFVTEPEDARFNILIKDANKTTQLEIASFKEVDAYSEQEYYASDNSSGRFHSFGKLIIRSTDGKFGLIDAPNVSFGLIDARDLEVEKFVRIGDIKGAERPGILFKGNTNFYVAGGSLKQEKLKEGEEKGILISGLNFVKPVSGFDDSGFVPAQVVQGHLFENKDNEFSNVTNELVYKPKGKKITLLKAEIIEGDTGFFTEERKKNIQDCLNVVEALGIQIQGLNEYVITFKAEDLGNKQAYHRGKCIFFNRLSKTFESSIRLWQQTIMHEILHAVGFSDLVKDDKDLYFEGSRTGKVKLLTGFGAQNIKHLGAEEAYKSKTFWNGNNWEIFNLKIDPLMSYGAFRCEMTPVDYFVYLELMEKKV